MKNLKLISLALFVFIGTVNGQQLEISKVNLPNLSGERSLTFDCPLDGNQKKDVEVWVYYSTNKEQLSEKNCPRGRATCKKSNDPNKMNCTFYFPHKDHMKPNKLHDSEINGGEPPSDDEMAELLEKYSEFEIFKKLNGDNAEKVFPKHYEAFKKLNNTDKNEVSINNPKKVYYKIERVKFKFKNNVDPNIIMKEESIYSTINEFTMPRVFTIGYMGDSFTSGEGAPYSGEDKWDDNLCHRSNKSGGMRAINKLIERRRDLVVRVINTTCSGAKIGNLINQPQHSAAAIYYPNKKNSTKYSQLDLIADWLKTNNRETVDIMLMGIGGNNIGFAEMATAASNPVRNPITWERDALAAIEDAKDLLKDLPNAYDVLNTAINNQDFEVGKILIMNYPNMLFGKNGKICDGTNTSPPACLDPTNFLFTHREAFKD
ncbi:MAG TPA: hypothetical protein PKL45_12435, partial [Bacteroidia bacterium]|nr:hypothetical protein [Bacteroidia bacterium]